MTINVTKRKRQGTERLPSGQPTKHVGVYHADNGKGFKACDQAFVLLGVYGAVAQAIAARKKYWQAKETATA
jgi:hypothetical protein